jgi:KDO2-lipid IV(A) lauroyltransferase
LHRLPRIFLKSLALLPLSSLHALGTVLGWIIYGISPTYRRHLRENLAQAGYRDASTRRGAIAHAGRMALETPAIWLRPQERVAALVREVSGFDAAIAARKQGKGILFLTPHMGSFEVAAQYASRSMPLTVLYRPPKMRWLDPLMREGRDRGDMHLAPADTRGVRELVAALRRGESVGFLPDQVPGEGEGEWAEFFGRPAYTVVLAAKLAERDNVVCFLAYAKRLPRGEGYAMVFRPLPEARPDESAVRNVNRALEDLIRECPEQYLWGYNRYKTPLGAPPKPA